MTKPKRKTSSTAQHTSNVSNGHNGNGNGNGNTMPGAIPMQMQMPMPPPDHLHHHHHQHTHTHQHQHQQLHQQHHLQHQQQHRHNHTHMLPTSSSLSSSLSPNATATTTTSLKSVDLNRHRSKLAQSLSRTIPPFVILRDSQRKLLASSFDKLSTINEKIEASMPMWQTIIDSKQSNIDTYIQSTTSTILQATILQNLADAAQIPPIEPTSKAFKNKGNELFQKKQYLDALLLYNEALRLYNSETSKDQQILSTIYSNRCLCLVHLEKFEEGASEATRGLECRSAEYLTHKLLYRRGICYFSLKKHARAKKDFQEAHRLVSMMSDPSDIQSIEGYLEKINKMKTLDSGDSDTADNQSAFPSEVDQRITFKYSSDNVGRMAEASENIAANTVLFQEKAYVSCLERSSHSSHCHNCFKEIFAPIYCKKCNHTQYCSDTCLKDDFDNFHERECCRGFLLLCPSESLIVIRILAKKAKEQARFEKPDLHYIPTHDGFKFPQQSKTSKAAKQLSPPSAADLNSELLDNIHIEESESQDGEPLLYKSNIYHPTYNLIYSFNPHYTHHPNSKLASIIFEAFILERFLQVHHKSLGVIKDDISMATLVHHLCQLSTYIFSIPVYVAQDDICQHGLQRFIPVKIAYAIFPMASLLNHSCDNNTLLQYNGTSLYIKSLKDIEKKEEVTLCYGPHSFHLDLQHRLESLRDEYYFTCRCKACNEKSGPNPLKCPVMGTNCPGVLLETVNMTKQPDDDDDEEDVTYEVYDGRTFTCNKCGFELEPDDLFFLTSTSLMSITMFNNAARILNSGQSNKEVEDLLLRALEIRKNIYMENSKKIGEIYDTLARFYITEDNYKEAVKYAEKSVNNIYVRLGHSHSTELARECAKLANIYINGGEPAKAIKAINTAEILLMRWKTEPGDEEILSQLRNHKKVLEASKVIPGTNKVEINLTQLWSQPDFDSDTFLHRMILYHGSHGQAPNK
ncbi:hypothetical protein SAMD00019534_006230 [Acytostelium subglobosum LB1]|uniref:hypothetical protein n=1 Tax=Acytostelium subglobosum LB1 TaxID=1410327 RepID=UPI000644AAB1|nr:hypothetical protein SAMD00019534_006230 [Acytostelium subglobosum LB1]GAM17448.1 hypothetical protein SAMD00019534_006230 [Acytostelium subglobosum LB1]|eukprot:XP_012759510.1 hypothetical protein SAMD00019534_006230 [Acytostelium subglobosum LB1]